MRGEWAAVLELKVPPIVDDGPITATGRQALAGQHVESIRRVIVGVRRVQFCTSYIRNEPFARLQFPVPTHYLARTPARHRFLCP